jgi:hypothetical protein
MGAAAWVPLSLKVTRWSLGNAEAAWSLPCRPNRCSLAAVSATSNRLPSIDISRQVRNHAPLVAGLATGTAARSSSARNGAAPNLALACAIPDRDGTCQPSSQESR